MSGMARDKDSRVITIGMVIEATGAGTIVQGEFVDSKGECLRTNLKNTNLNGWVMEEKDSSGR